MSVKLSGAKRRNWPDRAGKRSGRGSRNSYADKEKKGVFRRWRGKISWPAAGTVKGLMEGFLCAALGCLLLAGLAAGTLRLHRYAAASPFFAVKHVDVAGNVRISKEMVMDLAGVHVGDNSLAVSISEVERSLLATPWVQEVSVKRLLPDRFSIRIRERMPSFWVRKDGVLYYADARGVVIAPVETDNFLSLPTLVVEPGSEEILERLEGYLNDLRSGRFPVEYGAISSLSVSPGKGVEIYLEDREMRFSIAADDWSGNLERLGVALGDLIRRNALASAREIRAADGNVWVINSDS